MEFEDVQEYMEIGKKFLAMSKGEISLTYKEACELFERAIEIGKGMLEEMEANDPEAAAMFKESYDVLKEYRHRFMVDMTGQYMQTGGYNPAMLN